MRAEPDADQPLLQTDRAASYPAPDGTLTFDKLSSVFASGNKTRDDQPNHIRIEQRVPREVAELWAHMCPAQVYEVGAEHAGRNGDRRAGAVELRPVRRDHREGRPPHAARGRLRAGVHADVGPARKLLVLQRPYVNAAPSHDNGVMRHKRFALLAGVLLTLNLVLWLAPPGLALRQAVISKLFGPKLVRAEVIDRAPGGGTVDWRIDRGTIVSATATEVDLLEADGRQQAIGVDGSTQVAFHGRQLSLAKLKPGWRVLVTWQANDTNGLADEVQVEVRRPAKAKLKGLFGQGASQHRSPDFHLS